MDVESCVRGHHVYQAKWKPALNEVRECWRELDNIHDLYAVAITKEDMIVGYVPHKMSAAGFLFLGKEGSTINCKVTGKRTYSQDTYLKDIHKIIKLLAPSKSELEPPCKKFKVHVEESDDAVNVKSSEKLLMYKKGSDISRRVADQCSHRFCTAVSKQAIYTFVYTSCNVDFVSSVFGRKKVHMEITQSNQVLIFAIATCTALAHKKCLVSKQELTRRHLFDCFCNCMLNPFP